MSGPGESGGLAALTLTRAERAEIREVAFHKWMGWDSTNLFAVVERILNERLATALPVREER